MSTRKRTPMRVGVESRRDAKGRERHRAAFSFKGKPQRGRWRETFAEAKGEYVDMLAGLQAGTLSGDRGPLVRVAVDEFVAGIKDGSIRTRSGTPYKPSAITGYERDLRQRVEPAFGAARLSELRLPDVQRWADELASEGLAASTVRNVVNALRALYGWALPRGLAQLNPTRGLRLPTGGQKRDRIAPPDELSKLIAALLPRDQVALGLAGYAGLRLGELLALDWSSVDLEGRTLRVERSWDHGGLSFTSPKSAAGRRTVPISERLALLLADHRVLTDHRDGLLFPATADASRPVSHNALRDRMQRAWRDAELAPLGFHEARHTFASLAIAAGVNAKALSSYLGHANISITFDRYGHLMPGSEDEARGLLDAYLEG